MTITTPDEAQAEVTVLEPKTLLQKYFSVSLYRNAAFLILNAIMPAATGFLFWIIAARLYPAADIGIASASISAMTLILFFSTMGLEFGLIRFLPQTKNKSGEMVASCIGISALMAITISFVFITGIDIWAPSFHNLRSSLLFWISFPAITAIFSAYYLIHHLFIARLKSGYAFTQTVFFSLVRFLPMILLTGVLQSSGIFTGWGAGLLIGLLVSIGFLLKRANIEIGGLTADGLKMVGNMIRFSLSNFILNLLWMAPGLVLPLMVANQLGAQATAYFFIGWSVAGIILMIPAGVSLALFAEGANDVQRLRENAHKSLLLMCCLIVPAIILTFFFGEKVLQVFGKEYSSQATNLLWLLAISALPAAVNYTYFSIGRVQQRMQGVIFLCGIITATTLILSFVLVPRIGITGAGFGYLIAQSIPAIFTGFLMLKKQTKTDISQSTR